MTSLEFHEKIVASRRVRAPSHVYRGQLRQNKVVKNARPCFIKIHLPVWCINENDTCIRDWPIKEPVEPPGNKSSSQQSLAQNLPLKLYASGKATLQTAATIRPGGRYQIN